MLNLSLTHISAVNIAEVLNKLITCNVCCISVSLLVQMNISFVLQNGNTCINDDKCYVHT